MPVKLKTNYAVEYAKDFTSLALENKMIYATTDPVESAENVVKFFNTIYDSLTNEDRSETKEQ